MPKVFISYSHTAGDREWARSFAEALKERGISVWFDESDIRGAELWRESLEDGLRGSDVLVALLDAKGPAQPDLGFFFELGAAIGMKKRVVPIVPKDTDPSTLPLNLRLRRYLVRDPPEQTAEELSTTLLAA